MDVFLFEPPATFMEAYHYLPATTPSRVVGRALPHSLHYSWLLIPAAVYTHMYQIPLRKGSFRFTCRALS